MTTKEQINNLNLIHYWYASPTTNYWEVRLDSEAMESIFQRDEVICVIVGYNMLKYLNRRSRVFRRSRNINDYLQFKCGTYFDNVVFTCYTISPNDMILVCEDGQERILLSGFM